MMGKRVLEPQEVRLAFRDPFIRRRITALLPEQRAMALAEWEAEQAARRKGKPIRAERTSTTLADLLTPLFVANPFSAVRASFWRQSSDERDDGVADGRQAWLRRRSVDSFFPAALC